MSLKEQKREERQKAAEANAAAQKAANVAAAGEQKRRALEFGGRYQEGGSVFQVNVQQDNTPKNIQGGRDLSVNLSETLSFIDTAVLERRRIQTSQNERGKFSSYSTVRAEAGPDKPTKQPKQDPFKFAEESPISGAPNSSGGRDLSVNLSENLAFASDDEKRQVSTAEFGFSDYGEVYLSPPEKGTRGQRGKRQIKSSNKINLFGKPSTLDFLKEPGKAFQSGVVNFGLQLASIPIAAESLVKSGNVTKSSEVATKFYEERKAPELEGTLGLSQKAGEIVGFAYVSGAAGSAGEIGNVARGVSRYVQAGQAVKKTNEPGIISGKEKIGPDTYLISRGTETKPAEVPFTILEFGKRPTFENVRQVGDKPNLTPDTINYRGKLDKFTKETLGAKQTSEYTYKAEQTTSKGRRKYQEGLFNKQFQPIAEGTRGKLSDLIRGFTPGEKGLVEKPASVFVEGKADRFIINKNKYIPPKPTTQKPLGPSADKTGSAGAAGKSSSYNKRLTTEQTTKVKDMILSGTKQETIQKQPFDILFANPRTELKEKSSPTTINYETLRMKDEVSTQKGKRLGVGIGLKFSDDIATATKRNEMVGLNIGLKLKDDVTTIKTTKSDVKITEIFKIDDDVAYIQGRGLKTKITEELTFGDNVFPDPGRPPPPEERVPPPRLPIFGLPVSSRDYDAPSPPLGNNKDWRGNVPEFDIVGIYGKRQETTYTIGKVPGLKKSDKKRTQRPIKGFGTRLNITSKGSVFKKGGKVKIF